MTTAHRKVYNNTLALRKQTWEQEKCSISLYETNKYLPQWKKAPPALKAVFSQNCQLRVNLAFKAFFH